MTHPTHNPTQKPTQKPAGASAPIRAATECPLCSSAGGELIWSDELLRVVMPAEADYPGFVRVILQAHVAEMTDLAPEQRDRVMRTVWQVERLLRDHMRPDKVNLASLGNMVPHLHWHVIPRWRADRHFPGSVWSAPQRDPSAAMAGGQGDGGLAELPARALALRQALQAAFGPNPDQDSR